MFKNVLASFVKKAIYGAAAMGLTVAITAMANVHPHNAVLVATVGALTGLCAAVSRALTYDPAK